MARAQTQTFGQFQILVGDGQDPEEFKIICGLTSKGMERVASTNATVELDCDDEDEPGYEAEDVASFKCSISGAGVWAAQNHDFMLKWFRSGKPKNVKVGNRGVNVGDIEYEQAPAVLTTLSQNGEKGGKIQGNIAISFREMPDTVVKPGLAAPANTVLPSVAGIPAEDGTLTAIPGVWTGGPTFTYKWQRDNAGWADIAGATAKTYMPVAADVGKALRVIVTATNVTGNASATSAATAEVTA